MWPRQPCWEALPVSFSSFVMLIAEERNQAGCWCCWKAQRVHRCEKPFLGEHHHWLSNGCTPETWGHTTKRGTRCHAEVKSWSISWSVCFVMAGYALKLVLFLRNICGWSSTKNAKIINWKKLWEKENGFCVFGENEASGLGLWDYKFDGCFMVMDDVFFIVFVGFFLKMSEKVFLAFFWKVIPNNKS